MHLLASLTSLGRSLVPTPPSSSPYPVHAMLISLRHHAARYATAAKGLPTQAAARPSNGIKPKQQDSQCKNGNRRGPYRAAAATSDYREPKQHSNTAALLNRCQQESEVQAGTCAARGWQALVSARGGEQRAWHHCMCHSAATAAQQTPKHDVQQLQRSACASCNARPCMPARCLLHVTSALRPLPPSGSDHQVRCPRVPHCLSFFFFFSFLSSLPSFFFFLGA